MTSSPPTADFETAGSFNIHNDQILNSTVNMGDYSGQQQLPLQHDQYDTQQSIEYGSEGSADMSIEVGRGGKRRAEQDHDVSSNMVFNFGSDGQYEVMGTPPVRPRVTSRKSDGVLRREAAVRNATNSTKPGANHRSLSESLARMNYEEHSQPTATFPNPRNTRFARSRQPSGNVELSPPSRFTAPANATPRRGVVNNPTAQSATYTANSFMLPDLPNITELVSGTRNDGTPVFSRNTRSRSRFTSASYQALRTEHATIENVAIPEEEKAIFASLQLLKDKVAQLENANSESERRAQDYESEISDLRTQLQSESRRSPDSALGSEDDDETAALEAFRDEKTRLRAQAKNLGELLNRSERKVSVAGIQADRVRKERDELVTQIGVAYYNNEELKEENEVLREELASVKEELRELKEQQAMRSKRRSSSKRDGPAPAEREPIDVERPAGRESAVRSRKTKSRRVETAEPINEDEEDLPSRIAKVVEGQREQAASRSRDVSGSVYKVQHREQSAGAERPLSVAKRTTPARKPVPARRPVSAPLEREPVGTTRCNSQPAGDSDTDDTELSDVDTGKVNGMRRVIELEMRERHQREKEQLMRSAEQSLPRKSSLKDITAGLENVTNRRASLPGDDVVEATRTSKSVRVQSPHTSDASTLPQHDNDEEAEIGETSMLSNTSRRRRRLSATHSDQGMTSAFILPDITLHNTTSTSTQQNKTTCIHHNAASCTACHPFDFNLSIPTPIPITDRPTPQDPDITSATIRPAQDPAKALATVIKQHEDEITHLRLRLERLQRAYNVHDPALSMRQRVKTRADMEKLVAVIDGKCNQVYALYDVLEGQKLAAQAAEVAKTGKGGLSGEVGVGEAGDGDETMQSVSVELGRGGGPESEAVPLGLDGAYEDEESEELPWEGLSESE
ncbi:hypothetical protein B0A50_08785 [Salinomyces thailandicus]|uniref:Cep57 centrosome microtubule-binding domain-containing protein n=1 Tax=Salinomyces thailandicus TaxID=706561 RepID=A0A4U0TIS4_9PEZI|nr:hypothetical protein B0A50_08785 [Salinomyces thailandica]